MTEEQAAQIIEELPDDMTITEALEHIRQAAARYAEDDTEPTEEPIR